MRVSINAKLKQLRLNRTFYIMENECTLTLYNSICRIEIILVSKIGELNTLSGKPRGPFDAVAV